MTRVGYHELRARAYDVNGVFANSSQVAFELIIPPAIAITSPASGDSVTPNEPVTLTATVSRGTYSIAEVRFFVNSTLVGTDTTAPYSLDWTPRTRWRTQESFWRRSRHPRRCFERY